MSRGLRLVVVVLAAFLGISFLHVWLNIGFEKLGLSTADKRAEAFRVGFLPVT